MDNQAQMYRERTTRAPLAVLWERRAGGSSGRIRILPDGCLDVIWDGVALTIAGPDPVARWHEESPGQQYAALRLAGGTGPALIGIPAHELVERSVRLDDLWPAAVARRLTEAVAERPVEALTTWVETAAARGVDPFGARVLSLARRRIPVSRMAEDLGYSTRQLQRRSLAAFGYGPGRLLRIVRLQQALVLAGAGLRLAEVAADAGYADQAHFSRDVRELTGESPRTFAAGL